MRLKFILFLLICNSIIAFASSIDTVIVVSESMKKPIPNIVILPDKYSTQKESFAVLYILHGVTDDYSSWLKNVQSIKAYADKYNMIIVFPDGGNTSWYFDSLVDKQMNYETYLSKELIDAIDNKYHTIKNRTARAITGASMGGHGAFYLAFKHQDIWGAAGSTSGGMDIRPFPNNWDLPMLLGNYSENQEYWEKNTVINLVHMLKADSLKLIFDCGVSDFFLDVNRSLHKKLLESNLLV